jgi:uncharacterized repeat protein (TIGR02543 family)
LYEKEPCMRVYSALRWVALFALAVFAFAGIACSGDDGNISNDPPLSGEIEFGFDNTGEITAGTELSVTYTGDEDVTFQWYKDGEPIPGATDSTFTPDSAGEYTVTVIAEGHAPKTSDPITVTAPPLPGTIEFDFDISGEITAGTELSVTYTGDEDVTFQWYKDGEPIPGATDYNFMPDEAGVYTVTITAEGHAPKTSDPITVTGPPAPVVTFDKNNTDAGSTEAYPHYKAAQGTPATVDALPATEPTRIGHTFAGWNMAANGSGAPFTTAIEVTASITVYAQWTPITYSVVYDGNEHTGGSTAGSVHTWGVSASLTANGFTRTDHVFAGWNTEADGTGTHYADGATVVNLRDATGEFTLYAQWLEFAMRGISAGTFQMGQTGLAGSFPVNSITISRAFYMGKYAVTQEQYYAVMGVNPSHFHGGADREPAADEMQAKRPVEMVTWFDALEFCNKLSLLAGLTPVYTINNITRHEQGHITAASVTVNWGANGYRLPTEAEWEYACRAGTTTIWYTGDTEDAALQAAAWYTVNSGSMTREVGLKTPNAWGLYDMHGNVSEWVWDWNGGYTAGDKTDPLGSGETTARVVRGGGWIRTAAQTRSAFRLGFAPASQSNYVGFRIFRYQ